MFAIFKWILWCCMPYTLVLLGLAAVTLWLFLRRQVRPAIGLFLSELLLVVISLPVVEMKLGVHLESKYPPAALQTLPSADAIVLLGGGIGATEPDVPYPECYPAADRAVMAARLYHAGKAPLIIPTGEGAPLAEKPLLETMQVPASAILCEEKARDTAENAVRTVDLLKARNAKRILLVTSSWHLPRSMMLFRVPGLTVIPVGCDYEATLTASQWKRMPLWQKLPSAQAATQTAVYLKEWLGILFYSFRKPLSDK